MQVKKNQVPVAEAEEPPILGSWRNMYVAVLVLHLVLIVSLYLLSQTYA